MKIQLYLLGFILLTTTSFAQRIDSSHFDTWSGLFAMEQHNDSIVVLGTIIYVNNGVTYIPTFNYFVNNTIIPIKNTIFRNDSLDTLGMWSYSKICFDKNGVLYYTDDNIYKYNGIDWELHNTIDDSLKAFRKFGTIVTDIDNNIWVTTSVGSSYAGSRGYSEIWRLKKGVFELALRLNFSTAFYGGKDRNAHSFASLSNGSVICQFNDTRGYETNISGDIVIIDQKLGTTFLTSKTSGDTHIPNINSFNEIEKNKVHIMYDRKFYRFNDPKQNGALVEGECCSGISVLDLNNYQWKVFDKSNSLPIWNDGINAPFIDILPIDNQVYIATRYYLYRLLENDQLSLIDWKDIFPSARIFRMNKIGFQSSYYTTHYIPELYKQKEDPDLPSIIKIFKTADNQLAILGAAHLLSIPMNVITSAQEQLVENTSTVVVTDDILNIPLEVVNYSDYSIVDILGRTVLTGKVLEKIQISSIPKGFYIVQFTHLKNVKSFPFHKL